MANKSFWSPVKPAVPSSCHSIGRRGGYIAFGIAFVGSWLLVAGSFLGWDIPPVFSGDFSWWQWVLIFFVGIPLSFVVAVLGWMWFAACTVSFVYIPHDTWTLAEKLAPEKTALTYRIFTIFEVVACLPLILMAIGSIGSRYE